MWQAPGIWRRAIARRGSGLHRPVPPPAGRVAERGRPVRLKGRTALSPLLDAGFLEVTLRRHFQPLLDSSFDAFLAGHYPKGIAIIVNGRALEHRQAPAPLRAPIEIRL